MAIASRQELIDYCLRKLGEPVIKINIDETQLNDRIDEALQYFREYHGESLQKTFIKYVVTASHLVLTTNVAASFEIGETVTGSVSGATFVVYDTVGLNKVRTRTFGGTFIVGETITGTNSGMTATIAAGGIFIGDTQNRYLPLNDLVTNISNVMPLVQSTTQANDYMFDVRYQLHLNDIFNLNNSNIQYYTQVMEYMSLLDFTLNAKPSYRFNRFTHRLEIAASWDKEIKPDQVIVAEGFVALDPEGNAEAIYDDIFVKKYAYILIKRQWGENLSKYREIELVGGVKLNGQQIYDSAVAEQKELEDLMMTKFSAPLGFIVG